MKIGKLTLLMKRIHSDIYIETLDNKVYILKKKYPWAGKSMEDMEQSYNNYFNLKFKNGIVKIYNVWKEDNILYVRQEYLKGRISVRDWLLKPQKRKNINAVIVKIFRTLSDLAKQHIVNEDCGDGNWMIDKNLNVKMIDLECLVIWDENKLHFLGLGFLDLLLKFNKDITDERLAAK